MPRTVYRAVPRWTRPLAIALAGVLALLILLVSRTTGAPPPFTPVADSYVDTSQPSVNFGTSTQVRADGSPVVRAYLRFDPENLGGAVTKATLMVWANSSHSSGYLVYGVPNNAWGETTITAANAPPPNSTSVGGSGAFSANTWTQVDVTPLVTGAGPVSFALGTNSVTAMSLGSRESGAHAPQLVITTATGSDTQPPTAPGNLRTTAVGSTQVSLAWNASTDNVGVTGYQVYRNGNPVGAQTTATTFTDTGLSAGTTYTYTVTAFDAAGNSATSAGLPVTTTAAADTQPPTAPGNLRTTAVGSTQVSLAWNASTDNVGVTGYQVYRNGNPVGAQTTATTFTDTGLSAGTTYTYTVTAFDAAGNSATSAGLPVTTTAAADTQPPTAPGNLRTTAVGSTQVSLAWNASTDNVGVTGYQVYRNGNPVGAQTTATTFTDTGLSAGTTYTYTVTAFDAAGNSATSAGLPVTTTAAADTQPPTAPGNLRTTAVGSTQVSLAWNASTDNVGVTGYQVYRNGNPVGAQTTATTFTDTGLSAGTTYTYTVTAFDAAGNSATSAGLPVTTTAAADTQPPTAPGNLRTTAVGSTQVSLAWNASTDNVGVTGYQVYRNGNPVGAQTTATTFTDTGLSAGTTYTYTVTAFDAAGNSATSAGLPVTTSTPPPSGGDPVIAAAGDIACDPSNSNFNGGAGSGSNCRMLSTSDLLLGANLAAVLLLGDNQYYCGSLAAFQGSYNLSWGRVKSITHPAVGNHEYLTSGGTGCDSSNAGAKGYFTYFGAAAGTQGAGYYSFDVGAWHLIAINSNCGDAGGCSASSPQGKWLANDLANHKNVCTLAYWHIPLFSSGGRASSNTRPIWDQLYAAGADVVLTGHDHVYERFAPQTPTGAADPAKGIREWVVGTGGANHTSFSTTFANSEVRNASTYGVLKLTLHPTSYDWSFVPIAGGSFTDSGTGSCH